MLETSDAIIARPNYEESRYGTNLMLIMPPKKCSLGDIDRPCTYKFKVILPRLRPLIKKKHMAY
ncbi:hypothetical protein YC2023_063740 [Brassica napus]